jgi:hypothetical protein
MRATGIVDIFRLENRKIVGPRDMIHPVPETAANPITRSMTKRAIGLGARELGGWMWGGMDDAESVQSKSCRRPGNHRVLAAFRGSNAAVGGCRRG